MVDRPQGQREGVADFLDRDTGGGRQGVGEGLDGRRGARGSQHTEGQPLYAGAGFVLQLNNEGNPGDWSSRSVPHVTHRDLSEHLDIESINSRL